MTRQNRRSDRATIAGHRRLTNLAPPCYTCADDRSASAAPLRIGTRHRGSQAGRAADTSTAGDRQSRRRIKSWIKQRDQKPGNVYLGVPHRMDRPVSGVMVFARHARAARRLSEQFEGRLIRKSYWACVAGQVTPAAGTWIDFVRKVPGEPGASSSGRSPRGARSRAALPYLGHAPMGHLAGNRTRDRPHASDSRANRRYAGIPSWGIRLSERRVDSDPLMRMSGCEPSPCTATA